MTLRSVERASRIVGCAFGLGLALLIVLVARPTASRAGPTATVRFTVPLSGELRVTPPAPRAVLLARGLKPGGPRATGRFEVQNQTGRTIALRFRSDSPSSTALDDSVRVRLSAAGRPLADMTLGGLRRAGRALRLPSGVARRIEVQAWIPADTGGGYSGQQVDISLVPVIERGRGERGREQG